MQTEELLDPADRAHARRDERRRRVSTYREQAVQPRARLPIYDQQGNFCGWSESRCHGCGED